MPALLSIKVTKPTPILDDLKPYRLPFFLSTISVLAVLILFNHNPLSRMTAFDFNAEKAIVSNLTLGVTVVNAVIALGLLIPDDKVTFAAQAGLFALLTVLAPLLYSMTINGIKSDATTPVWSFLLADFLILLGSCCAFRLAILILNRLSNDALTTSLVALFNYFCWSAMFLICIYAVPKMHDAIRASKDDNGEARILETLEPTPTTVRNLL